MKKIFYLLLSCILCVISASFLLVNVEAEGNLGEWTGDCVMNANDSVTIKKGDWNNFVFSDIRLKAFELEADMRFDEGNTAGLLFGAATASAADLGSKWSALHVRKTERDVRLFCEETWSDSNGLNESETISSVNDESIKLKLSVTGTGEIKAYVNGDLKISATQADYEGGYVGFCSCQTKATFSNIKLVNNDPAEFTSNIKLVNNDPAEFTSNLNGWEEFDSWRVTQSGDRGNNLYDGENLFFSSVSVEENASFVYEGDIHIENETGVGGLVFGANDKTTSGTRYVASVDKKWDNVVRLYKKDGTKTVWEIYHFLSAEQIAKKNYRLRVEVLDDGSINYYLDGALLDTRKNERFLGGYFGVSTCLGDVTFNNVNYYRVQTPKLSGLELIGAELNEPFDETTAVYTAVVEKDTSSVRLKLTADDGFKITIDSRVAVSGAETDDIALNVGENQISVNVKDAASGVSNGYVIHITRLPDMETIYEGDYRSQFHYSPQLNWMNDPNGLIYNAVTGEYHMFYQYNPYGDNMGNQSWGHAISKDLVHWTELPVALYPDEYGTKWSGSAVIDYYNTTGFFNESVPPESRMVLVAMNFDGVTGVMLAYSADNGYTWTKHQGGKSVIQGIGDPKVVWYPDASMGEHGGCWLMITTEVGLYTSSDLKNWTFNSHIQYKDGTKLNNTWECPDLYPLALDGDKENVKWVYNAAGSFYMVGDITKDANGKLTFKAETDPILYTGDSHQYRTEHFAEQGDGMLYATQSFYNDVSDRRISISWLRESTGSSIDSEKRWNGNQTIPLETTLVSTANGPRLKSYPVEELASLRDDLVYFGSNVTVTPSSENILDGKEGTLLDIIGEFTFGGDVTEFGFKLRVGYGLETVVKYDIATQSLVLDKSLSGEAYNGISVIKLAPLDGNKVKIRILVDATCIDVFGNDGEAAILTCYFPDPDSNEMSFYVKGGSVVIDNLAVYSMKSAWNEYGAGLTNIALSHGTLSPSFRQDTFRYTATVDKSVSSIKIKTLFIGVSSVRINGKEVASDVYSENIKLKSGENTITIEADGKTYIVIVTRAGGDFSKPVVVGSIIGGALLLAVGTFVCIRKKRCK